MPAKSERQRGLMAMVYAYKKGKLKTKKVKLIDRIRKMAKNLSLRQLKDYIKK